MIGATISHYKILEKLGEGGMGIVYKAHDITLDRPVALKFLAPYLTSDPTEKERFYQEARAAAALTHPNIAVVYEIGEHEDQIFIAMEYIEGRSLRSFVGAYGDTPVSIPKAIDIAIQTCEGLTAAHEKGIVHRDIKSDNIMLTPKGQVKIMDFGLAKLRGVSRLTREGTTLGTIPYMSPEQVQGIEVDQRSDIFSFGVVLYEMISGQLPFKGEHEPAVIYSITNDTPEPLARYKSDVPEGLQGVVDKALAKERDERYQHVDEMLVDLRALQQKREPVQKMQRKTVKLPGLVGIGIVIVMMIVLGYLFLPPKPATVTEQSIAVLPFVDMSPQRDQEYFCDGMTEDLINRLSNVQELRVPARTSAFVFKGKTQDIQDIGEKLKVQTVLEGSVQKSGDRLRITAQLINVADGFHLWSEKYDRDLKDVFGIQDEISSAIVNALQVKLTSQEQEKISEHPLDNIKVYEYYLKAHRLTRRFDEKSLDSAFVLLQNAIDIMGDNAELFSGMADVLSQYANIGVQQEDYLKRAEEYAKKALALKPDQASALGELAYLSIYKGYPENMHDAFHYYRRTLTANPNEIEGLRGMVMTYVQVGKPSEALALMERLERQDPLNPDRYVTRGYYCLYGCQFEAALEQFKLLYQTNPAGPLAQTSYSQTLALNGQRDEAIAVIDQIGASNRNNVLTAFSLLLKYALLNDKESALRLITPDFRKTCWRDFEWSYWVANRLSLAGAKEESLDWLENAVHRGFINYPFMQCDPFLNNVRGEERFKKLMDWAKYEWEHFEVPE